MVCVILVAEDEVMVRNIVRHLLEAESHEVLAAADGQEALQISRQYNGTIDLLITDVVMPRLDGFGLIRQIQQERPNLRILVMTGHSPTDVSMKSPAAFPLLRKPFGPAAFLAKVRQVLNDQDPPTKP
jgi:two-component system, cell cycle sensor histidine kinase and response regulator CckA